MLTDEQKAFYRDRGYLRIPGVFEPSEVEAMRAELDWIFSTWADHNAAWKGPWREAYMTEAQRETAVLVAINDMHLHSELWLRIACDRRLVDTVPVTAEAGDVVLFSLWTVHGSDLNRLDHWRRAVRLGYRDPANPQLDGHALGRLGWVVRGRRPRVAATMELKR